MVGPVFLKIKLPLFLKEANLGLFTRQQGAKNVEIETAKSLEAEAPEPQYSPNTLRVRVSHKANPDSREANRLDLLVGGVAKKW